MSDNDNYINTLDIVYTNVKKPHIYKIINLINKKYYYGVHNGNNTDSYLGSGKLLHQAYKKYGINNFKKEILLYFDTIEEAFEYEKIIINEKMINKNNPMCYNICVGGLGGDKFSCQSIDIQKKINFKRSQSVKETYKNMSIEKKQEIYNKRKKNINNEIKLKISNTLKEFQQNKTDEQKQQISNKIKETYENMSIEQKEEFSNKIKNAYKNMSIEKKKEISAKRKETYENMSIEQKQEIYDKVRKKLSETQKGKKLPKYLCPYNHLIIYSASTMSQYIKKNYPNEKQWIDFTEQEKFNFLI